MGTFSFLSAASFQKIGHRLPLRRTAGALPMFQFAFVTSYRDIPCCRMVVKVFNTTLAPDDVSRTILFKRNIKLVDKASASWSSRHSSNSSVFIQAENNGERIATVEPLTGGRSDLKNPQVIRMRNYVVA